ncbi:uncharacterized protein LOC143295133 [Babylonia areolata]|uniref:uncharacterized protein LOC143295133 n=1 Tax=Babylonia areolata TaxID=304850 RepID=UPI003FD15D19
MGCRFSYSVHCCCQPTRGGSAKSTADKDISYAGTSRGGGFRARGDGSPSTSGNLYKLRRVDDRVPGWEASHLVPKAMCRVRFSSAHPYHPPRTSALQRCRHNERFIEEGYSHPAKIDSNERSIL